MTPVLVVSLILTAWSALTLWLIGTPRWAWLGFATGIACQGLWIAFDAMTGAYGLLPLAFVYGPLYARGWWNYDRNDKDHDAAFVDGVSDGWQRAMEAEHPPEEDEIDDADKD